MCIRDSGNTIRNRYDGEYAAAVMGQTFLSPFSLLFAKPITIEVQTAEFKLTCYNGLACP